MKKNKFFILFIVAVTFSALGFFSFNLTSLSQTFADSELTNVTYVISNSVEENTFTLKEENDNSEIISAGLTEVLNEIIDRSSASGYNLITISFDNAIVNETIILNDFSNLTLTGKITSQSDGPIFEISQNENQKTISLTSLKLVGEASQNLININASGVTINAENCNFSSKLMKSYAIFFDLQENSLNFGGEINHETTYFSNYFDNLSLSLLSKLSSENNVTFTFPYNITKNELFECDSASY
jgi:hypothetical protein